LRFRAHIDLVESMGSERFLYFAELALDPAGIRLFDPATGERLLPGKSSHSTAGQEPMAQSAVP
jgi:hypothetical protein